MFQRLPRLFILRFSEAFCDINLGAFLDCLETVSSSKLKGMKIPALLVLPLCFGLLVPTAHAAPLTPEQIEVLKSQLEALKQNLDSHVSDRNSTAGQNFAAAAGDPRAAVELYLNCYKAVHFDREARSESDFRAWKDGQADRLRDEQFLESLQHQLRYLALSCQAAQTEKIEEIFNPLLNYVDGLSRLENPPANSLTESVANSVFARTYYLERLLGNNPRWESVPFNIGGIYEKTIMPFLREEKPEALMGAWDKRIEQETRLVMMLEEAREKELRGMNKDQERRAKTQQDRQGGVLGNLDKEKFIARTLPDLKWSKLKDQFLYIDQVMGAKAMLDFVEEHLTHEFGEKYFEDFMQTLEDSRITTSGDSEPAPESN